VLQRLDEAVHPPDGREVLPRRSSGGTDSYAVVDSMTRTRGAPWPRTIGFPTPGSTNVAAQAWRPRAAPRCTRGPAAVFAARPRLACRDVRRAVRDSSAGRPTT
jgi:hypothetical protein